MHACMCVYKHTQNLFTMLKVDSVFSVVNLDTPPGAGSIARALIVCSARSSAMPECAHYAVYGITHKQQLNL